jgi:uncharacterized protein (DUF1015 family)
VAATTREQPLFDFVAPDEIRHRVWTIADARHPQLVDGFAALPALYIADGHHRAASAARARRALAGRGVGEHDRVLAVAFPDDQVQILPYNRVVKDLSGRSADEFIGELRKHVPTNATDSERPSAKGHVHMYLAGRWYEIDVRGLAQGRSASDALDVSLLQDVVLDPLLGIKDVRTDKRIDFVGGIRGAAELTRLVDSGAWAVAFALHPVTVQDLMTIADAGGIMPPKSTWFEPKLRDGLLSHLI